MSRVPASHEAQSDTDRATTARRRFLSRTAVVAGAAALPLPARAFSEVAPDAELLQQYRNACGNRARVHSQMIAEVRGFLNAKEGPAVPETRVQSALKAVDCPFCGCSLDKAPVESEI